MYLTRTRLDAGARRTPHALMVSIEVRKYRDRNSTIITPVTLCARVEPADTRLDMKLLTCEEENVVSKNFGMFSFTQVLILKR